MVEVGESKMVHSLHCILCTRIVINALEKERTHMQIAEGRECQRHSIVLVGYVTLVLHEPNIKFTADKQNQRKNLNTNLKSHT